MTGDSLYFYSPDGNIGDVRIAGNAAFLEVLAGCASFTTVTNSVATTELFPVYPDAQIGRVLVQGDWMASSITAGVHDLDQDGFGNGDDVSPGTAVSLIERIQIDGRINGTAAPGDHFGFTAAWIKNLRIGGSLIPLDAGPSNDKAMTLPGVSTGDMLLNEVSPPRRMRG